MTVILARHGRSVANTARVLAGRAEGVDLDDVRSYAMTLSLVARLITAYGTYSSAPEGTPEEAEAEQAARILREEMEGCVQYAVPLSTDVHAGKNWLEAH